MDSPCTRICIIGIAHPYCTGCGRTLAEIAEWGSASEDRHAAIWADLPKRMASIALVGPNDE